MRTRRPFLTATAAIAACLLAGRLPSGEEPDGRRIKVVSADGVSPLSTAQQEASRFSPADSAGLFIGVRSFEDGKDPFPEVPFAADDAVDLAHAFAFELELLPPAKATIALSGEPQKEESRARLAALREAGATVTDAKNDTIRRTLVATKDAAGEKGILVLTVATHGYQIEGTYRLLAQNTMRSFLVSTSLNADEVLDFIVDGAASRRQLVLIDACRERLSAARQGVGRDPRSSVPEAFAQAAAEAEGIVVFLSARAGGYSYDDSRKQNGVFTSTVLEGLRGASPPDARGFITPATLGPFVNARVSEWVAKNRTGDGVRGIGYRSEDLRSGDFPLAFKPNSVEDRQRLLSGLARSVADETVLAEVRWVVGGSSGDALEPVFAKLEDVDRDPEYFRWWWLNEGRARFGPKVALAVEDTAGKARATFRDGEEFVLEIAASKESYLTVLRLGADGVVELAPEYHNLRTRYEEVGVVAGPPYGEDRYVAIATVAPLAFEDLRYDGNGTFLPRADGGDAEAEAGQVLLARKLAAPVGLRHPGTTLRYAPLEEFLRALTPEVGSRAELAVTTEPAPRD